MGKVRVVIKRRMVRVGLSKIWRWGEGNHEDGKGRGKMRVMADGKGESSDEEGEW